MALSCPNSSLGSIVSLLPAYVAYEDRTEGVAPLQHSPEHLHAVLVGLAVYIFAGAMKEGEKWTPKPGQRLK